MLRISVFLLAALGLLALYSAWGAWRVEQVFPPAGEFVDAAGLRLHLVDEGTGPAIVLLHGASTTLRDFTSSLMPTLDGDHRVLAFDRPGYGYSERPPGDWPDPAEQARYLHSALQQLGVKHPVLVGHSWSGSLVMAYLLNYPGEAAGAVLLAGGTHPWEGGVAWTNTIGGVPLVGPLFAHTLLFPAGELVMAKAVANVFAPEAAPPDYIARTGVKLVLRPDNYFANAEDVRRLSDYLAVQSRDYASIREPLLLIHGTADDIVPAWNHTDRLLAILPAAQVVRLVDAGHAPHHTRTEQVSNLIREFARRANGPGGT